MDEQAFQDLLRYQALLSRQVVQEAKTDRKIKLMSVLNTLLAKKNKVQTAAVLHEAESLGLSESDTYQLLDELVEDRIIKEKDSYVSRS